MSRKCCICETDIKKGKESIAICSLKRVKYICKKCEKYLKAQFKNEMP